MDKKLKELAKKARVAKAAAERAYNTADALAIAAAAAYVTGNTKYELAKDAYDEASKAYDIAIKSTKQLKREIK